MRLRQLRTLVLPTIIGLATTLDGAAAWSAAAPLVSAQLATSVPSPTQMMRVTQTGARAMSVSGVHTAVVTPTTPNSAAPEIVALARALKYNPDLIYQYVYNNIKTIPQYDSIKGPVGTLLDGQGTPIDQAELMALLLRQAAPGVTPNATPDIEIGTVTMTSAQLTNWLGVDTTQANVNALLGAGGFGTNLATSNPVTSVTLPWAWVVATVNGQANGQFTYYNPSLKTYNRSAGLAASTLASAIYKSSSTTALVSAAEAGATVSLSAQPTAGVQSSVANLNYISYQGTPGVQPLLTSYASNLVNYIKTNQPAAATQDIIGGVSVAMLSPALPPGGHYGQGNTFGTVSCGFLVSNPTTCDFDPTAVAPAANALPRTVFTVSVPGASGQGTVSLNTSDMYGHALFIYIDSNSAPEIWLDSTQLTVGTPVPTQNNPNASFLVTYTLGYPGPLSYADLGSQPSNQLFQSIPYGAPNLIYAVSTSWGPVGRGMVEKQRKLLATDRATIAVPTSGPYQTLAQSLTMLGLTWGAEYSSLQNVTDRLAGTSTVALNTIGIVGLKPVGGQYAPYLDMTHKTYFPAQLSGAAVAFPSPVQSAVTFVDDGIASALESTMIEQTQPGVPAASMTKLFALEAQAGTTESTTLYDVDNDPTNSYQSITQGNFQALLPQLAANGWCGSVTANGTTVTGTGNNQPYCLNNTANDLGNVNTYVTGNQQRVILPLNGGESIGLWQGAGYWVQSQGAANSNQTGVALGTYVTGGFDDGDSGSADGGEGGDGEAGNDDGMGGGTGFDGGGGGPLGGTPSNGDAGGGYVDGINPGQVDEGAGTVQGTANPAQGAGVNGNTVGTDNPAPSDPAETTPAGGTPGSSSTQPQGADPVSLVTGDFQDQHADISVGAGKFPYKLTFKRSYDSSQYLIGSTLGQGWNYNFAVRALQDSDTFEALGSNSPISGSTGIAAIYVALQVLNTQNTTPQPASIPLDHLLIATLIDSWFAEGTVNNIAAIVRPSKVERFVKLADCSYSRPMHSSANLYLGTPGACPTSGTYTYIAKTGQFMTFDTAGFITNWVDPDGAYVQFSYNNEQLSSVTNSVGRTLTLNYSSSNAAQLQSVSDNEGRSVSYGFGSTGQLTSFTDPLGSQTTYGYDANNRLQSITYPSYPSAPGVSNVYDALGHVQTQQDAKGNTTSLYFAGSRTETDDPAGDAHVTYYDPRGNLLYDIDGLGNTTGYTYDGLSRMITQTLPELNYFAYTYDSNNNMLTEAETAKSSYKPNQGTRSRSWAYDSKFNKVTVATDFSGDVTTNVINQTTGTVTSTTLPQPPTGSRPVYSFLYNTQGQLTQTTDPLGMVTLNAYDSNGDLTSTTVDQGRLALVTGYGYDAVGNQNSVTDPNGNITTTSYDADRRPTVTTPPVVAGSTTVLTTITGYDADGRVLTTTRTTGTSAPNQVTTYTYTPTGKMATKVDPSNDTTTYSYDAADRLVAIVDGAGLVNASAYDADSRVTLLCKGNTTPNPALSCQGETPLEQRTYQPNGGVKQRLYQTAANGWQGLLYSPDGFDRVHQIVYPDGTFEQMQYDVSDDMLTHVSRGNETISWSYDRLHRKTAKTGSPNVAYAYDAASDLLSATVSTAAGGVPAGTWSRGYDTAERQTSDTGVLGTVTYGLDKNGNRTSLTYPNGTIIPTQFDALNRPSYTQGFGATANTSVMTEYYDPFDRLYSRNLGLNLWYTNFAYDVGGQNNLGNGGQGLDLNRVFDSQGGNGVYTDLHYSYDTAHKISQFFSILPRTLAHPTAANMLTGLTANTSNELLNPASGQTITYNADGNLTSDSVRSYTYDAEGSGRILTATNGSSSASYTYDPFGQRISKTMPSGTVTQYQLDNHGREIGEYNAAGNLLQALVYDPFQTAPVVSLAGPAASNGPTGTAAYYEVDRIGSVVATSSGSSLANTYAYLPYGDTPNGKLPGTNFGYAGYRYDSETGTYHTRTRSYDPRLGRFLQTDPIGQQGGVNIYAYVTGDPINNSDIAGTQPAGADDTTDEYGGEVPGTSIADRVGDALLSAAEDVAGEIEDVGSFVVEHPLATAGIIGTEAALGGPEDPAADAAAALEAEAAEGGSLAKAAYAQKTYSQSFSSNGSFAGQTVSDVANSLTNGTLTPADVPVQTINRDGNTLIMNTRSAQALDQAGVPRGQWNTIDMTGDSAAEARLSGQLQRNGLTSQGTMSVRPSGGN